MEDKSNINKRIAKNTFVLYLRMIFLMAINIYTTRVVLQALGVNDYGIYNVVGGIVAFFSILSKSLATASSRFLNYEMGRGDFVKLRKVFSISVTIQAALALLIALLIEVLGVWFLNNKMVIETERLTAANWVLQFSIITFCFNLISVPYNAAIIAHEKMSVFAYISIFEGIAKLLICYMVMILPMDNLVMYAFFICIIHVSIRFIYAYYCKHHFSECTYKYVKDTSLIKELFSFAGWNFIGASAMVIRNQGGNILINLFFGTSINAARAIANQVNIAVSGFVNNFMIAVNPQITQSYSREDKDYSEYLVQKSAKLSFYLLLLLSLPIIINIDYILGLWLYEVPEKTSVFVILTVLLTMIESLSVPLSTLQLATGKVRNYQLIVGGITLLNIPFSYELFLLGYDAEAFLIVAIIISFLTLFIRLFMLKINAGLSIRLYIKRVVLNCSFVTIISAILPSVIMLVINRSFYNNGFYIFLFSSVISTAWCFTIVLFLGCTKGERLFLKQKIKTIYKSHFN